MPILAHRSSSRIPGLVQIRNLRSPQAAIQIYGQNLFESSVESPTTTVSETVVQLYVSLPETSVPGAPVLVLRGFKTAHLEAGKGVDLEFMLKRRDLSYWNVALQDWVLPHGQINVQLGFSSRDYKTHRAIKLL